MDNIIPEIIINQQGSIAATAESIRALSPTGWSLPPVIEGSLEVKLPTVWTIGKAEVGRVREEKRRKVKIKEVR